MNTGRAELLCVVVASIAAVLSAWMPLKLGILVAMLAGVTAAMLIPEAQKESHHE
jgi:predicted branched-subunit amino acid permease